MATESDTERLRIILELEAEKAEKQAKSLERQIGALERRFDPLAKATQKYEHGQRTLNKALEAGTIDAAKHKSMLDNLSAEYAEAETMAGRAAKAVNANSAANGTLTGVLSRNSSMFQQAGYQINDFAIQVGGGTSAVTAFAQQGSQMLGMFGAFGAVAGAGLAIAAPLAMAFFDMGDGAEEAADGVEALAEGLSALEGDISTIKELQQQYVEAVIRGQDEIAASIGKEIGLRTTLLELRRIELEQQLASTRAQVEAGQQLVTDLQEQASKIREFDERGTDYVRTQADRERVEYAKELVEANSAALLELRKQATELELQEHLLVQIDDAIEQSVDAANRLTAESGGAAGALGGAASEAGRLAHNLGIALSAAMSLQNTRNAKEYSGRGGDPREFMEGGSQSDYESSLDYTPVSEMIDRYTPKVSTGGGRGGGVRSSSKGRGAGSKGGSAGSKKEFNLFEQSEKQVERLQQQIELIGKTKTQVAELSAKWAMLSAAKKEGIDLDARQSETGETVRQQIDRQAASIGALTEEYEKASERAQLYENIQDQLKDGMVDAIVEGNNFADVLANVAQMLAKAALQAALFGEGPMAGGGGGLLSNLFSGVFGGGGGGAAHGSAIAGALGGAIAGARANGGPVSSGESYLVGERGPEIFRPDVPGAVTPNHALGGPAQRMQVELVGGDLVLTDGGEITARFSAKIDQASAATERRTLAKAPGYMAEQRMRTGRG